MTMNNQQPRNFSIRIGDKTFQVSSDDEYLEAMRGVFEPQTVDLFRALVKRDGVALDVGANVGCTALLLSTLARKTVAFEPSPTTFNFLQKNVETASANNVIPVNAGLGSEPASLNLVIPPVCRGSGVISDTPLANHMTESIKIIRGDDVVDSILGSTPVDFIKIDVEGFELSVLNGLTRTLARDRPVVTFELNHWALNVFRRITVPDFLEEVCRIFPVLYAIGRGPAVNLHDADARYLMMHAHIVHFDYTALVGAFDETKIDNFLERYVRNPPPAQAPFDAAARIASLEEEQRALEERRRTLEKSLALERMMAEAARNEAGAKLLEATQQRQALAHEIDALRNSTSWRVTSPLRAVKRLIQ